MEFQELFLNRRSIRRYTNESIDQQILKAILTAAMYAPSAVNRQPWHFVVLDDRAVMDRVMAFHPYAGMLSSAPLAIVVCGDLDLQHDDGYWVVDCGAATENLLLAAHYHGLGACWVGLHPREGRKKSMAELLDLPAHIQPFSLVVLGHPAETRNRPDRFQPVKVRRNSWKNFYYRKKQQ